MNTDDLSPDKRPLFENIKLVVFDLDGTLVDTFDDIAAAANHALAVLGLPSRTVAEIKSYVGHGGKNLMRSLMGPDVGDDEVERAFEQGFQEWRAYYREHPADFSRPYPGALEVLKELKSRGIQIGVLSNKVNELTRSIVQKLGLEPYIDLTYGELASRPRKPDPALLQHMLNELGASLSHTIIVGDGDADMELASNAGIPAIGVSYGVHSAEELRQLGASVIVDDLREILQLLR